MKKKSILLLAVLTLLLTAGCGKTEEQSTPSPAVEEHVEDGMEKEQAEESFSGGNTSQQDGPEEERQSLDAPANPEPPAEPEAPAEQEPSQEEFQFSDLSDRVFYFSSGAGAWFTELRIGDGGSFEGHYHDANMGDWEDSYPNGTLYYCDFYGTFGQLEKVDDFTYKMKLLDISFEQEPESEEIIDGVRYIYSDAYGLDGEDFYLYLPGSKLADLPQAFRQWVGYYDLEAVQEEELSFYGLYNVQEEQGFSSGVYTE